jgi:hypothetical protein
MSDERNAADARILARPMIARAEPWSAADLEVVSPPQTKLVAEKFDRNKSDMKSLVLN